MEQYIYYMVNTLPQCIVENPNKWIGLISVLYTICALCTLSYISDESRSIDFENPNRKYEYVYNPKYTVNGFIILSIINTLKTIYFITGACTVIYLVGYYFVNYTAYSLLLTSIAVVIASIIINKDEKVFKNY